MANDAEHPAFMLPNPTRWLIAAVLILASVIGGTVAWQRSTLEARIERGLTEQLRQEGLLVGALLAGQTGLPPLPAGVARRLTLIDPDGAVLADSAADLHGMDNHNSRPEVLAARRDGFGLAHRASGTTGRPYLYAARLLPDGRILRLAAPLEVEAALQDQVVIPVAFSTALVAGLIGIVMVIAAWRIRRRAAVLVDVSRAFAAGDLTRRSGLEGNDAYARIGRELDHLGERLSATQDRLAEQRRLLEVALGSLAEGVACIDRFDRIVYANPAFRQFAAGGLAVEGDPFYRHLSHEAVGAAVTALRDGHDLPPIPNFEHRRRQFSAAVAGTQDTDADGEAVAVLVLHDRTELNRLENARRDFLASVSHELKTPLTAIVGATDVLLDGALDEPATARSFVDSIARHADRLSSLVRDVLTISRLEQGAWEVRPQTVDFTDLAHLVREDHRAAAAAKPVTLLYEGPDRLPGAGDPELYRQLVGNLVSNAVRYNRPGGTVTIRQEVLGDRLQIIVADNGIGIPAEHRERIFERFYRVDSHRSRATGGTGLGLSIVKHLVERLHGTIDLESSDAGTTFTATLPLSST